MLSQLALPRCFPKASAKVVQLFETANKRTTFFDKNLNFFKQTLIFSTLQNDLFCTFFTAIKKHGANRVLNLILFLFCKYLFQLAGVKILH